MTVEQFQLLVDLISAASAVLAFSLGYLGGIHQ